jgi:ABC-type multidrug transport system ATPase subunit
MMCAKERAHITKYCGYLPQTDPLIPELSVQDNINLWTGSLGRPDEKLVKLFELDDILRTRSGQLSGGMKRRVSIACAVSLWPPILLMDEPTASPDSGHRESVHKLMEDYRKLDGTIVIATHDEEEIRMSDKCCRIDK